MVYHPSHATFMWFNFLMGLRIVYHYLAWQCNSCYCSQTITKPPDQCHQLIKFNGPPSESRNLYVVQFLADLDRIPFHKNEEIHRGLGNLGNRMKVGGHNDRYSPHPEAIDMDSNNSISYELEQLCATMTPRPFVYHGYVCCNYGTTLPQYLE